MTQQTPFQVCFPTLKVIGWNAERTSQKSPIFLQNHEHDLLIKAQEPRTSGSFCLWTSYLTDLFINLSTFPDAYLREQFLRMLFLISTPQTPKPFLVNTASFWWPVGGRINGVQLYPLTAPLNRSTLCTDMKENVAVFMVTVK